MPDQHLLVLGRATEEHANEKHACFSLRVPPHGWVNISTPSTAHEYAQYDQSPKGDGMNIRVQKGPIILVVLVILVILVLLVG